MSRSAARRNLRARNQEVRRLALILHLHGSAQARLKTEIAASMVRDWDEVPRTFIRDVDWLAAHGWLEETEDDRFRYPLGRCPSFRLTVDEWQRTARVIEAIAFQHPNDPGIRRAQHVLRSALRWNRAPDAPADPSGRPTLLVRGRDVSRSVREAHKRQRLEAILHQRRAVTFRYHPATSPPGLTGVPENGLEVRAQPLGLIYWGELDGWYLVARPLDPAPTPTSGGRPSVPASRTEAEPLLFRLDRMEEPEAAGEPDQWPPFDLHEYLGDAWGMERGRPTSVEVRFRNIGHVAERVQRTAALREHARVSETPDGDLLYTDVVAGLGEFSRWVRQFGMAAQVVQPAELRSLLRNTAEAWVSMYERAPEPVGQLLAAGEEVAAVAEDPGQGSRRSPRAAAAARVRQPGGREPAMERLAFLVGLLRYLAVHPGSTVAQIARAMEAEEEGVFLTLRLVLEEHSALIPLMVDPPDAEGDALWQARWSLMEGFAVPPVELEPWDLVSLIHGLELFDRDPTIRSVVGILRNALEPWLGPHPPQTLYRLLRGRNALFESEAEAEQVAALHGAARSLHEVRLSYRGRGETSFRTWRVRPLSVVFAWDPGAWYLVAWPVEGDRPGETVTWQGVPLVHLRLDRMSNVQVLGATFAVPPAFDLAAYLKPIWGIEAGTEPVRTVVRFRDEVNVLEKAHRETAHRTRARWYTLEDGAQLYVDSIVGENEFLRWIRGFGRSAEVLEPIAWRDRMLQTARALLQA